MTNHLWKRVQLRSQRLKSVGGEYIINDLFNLILYQMQQQLSPRAKTVEHYQLNSLLWSTPIAQFWTASHKVLKKSFVLKKIKMLIQGPYTTKTQNQMLSGYDVAKYETSLLNGIKLQGLPRCHKLIRTTASTYVVYDAFPGETLMEHTSKQKLTAIQLIKLLGDIARQVEKFHLQGISFYLLSASNIYVGDDNRIVFTDCTLARKNQTCSYNHRAILQSLQQTPHFHIKPSSTSQEADLYSLGKIFDEVCRTYQETMEAVPRARLQKLISQMIKPQEGEKMDMKEVIKSIKAIRQMVGPVEQPSTPTFVYKANLNKTDNIQSKISRTKIKRAESNFQLLHQKAVPETKTSRGLQRKNTIHPASSKITSSNSSEQSAGELSKTGRVIFKHRSLAFFLLSLSQFMHEKDPIISFMLLKKARLAFKTAFNECQELRTDHTEHFKKVSTVINSEMGRVESLLRAFKLSLSELALEFKVKRELSSFETAVDLKFLHEKIKLFLKEKIKNPQQRSVSFSQMSDLYYQMYMLAKTLECGSYQLFWDQEFQWKDPVKSAEYLSRQKKFGLRFFKSNLEEIIQRQL